MKIIDIMSKEKNIFNIEAKKIRLLSENPIHINTILDVFASTFGFAHSEYIKTQDNKIELNDFIILNLWQLEYCEQTIIKKLKALNINTIEQIDFIRNEIEIRKNNILNHNKFNLFELLSIMHLITNSDRLINKDWSLNEDTVKSFLFWYASEIKIAKYNTNNISCFDVYKEYQTVKERKRFDFHLTNLNKFDNILQRGLHYATVTKDCVKNECADGILFNLIFKYVNKEILMDDVYSNIEHIIKYEREYHAKNSVNYPHPEGLFELSPPTLINISNTCFNAIDEHFDDLKTTRVSSIIGYTEEKSNIWNRKAKKTNKIINDESNVFSIGADSSDVIISHLSLLIQDIFKNKTIIYFENRNNYSTINTINNIAANADRLDDMVYLNFENAESFLTQKRMEELINSKKIIVINFPYLEKINGDIFERVTKLYDRILNNIIQNEDNKKQINTSAIYLNDLESVPLSALQKVETLFKTTNHNSLHFRLSCFDLTIISEKRELVYSFINDHIDYCRIMKCYDPTETLDFFIQNKSNNNILNIRDVKDQSDGVFFLFYDKKILPEIFKSISCDENKLNTKYLNPPFYY